MERVFAARDGKTAQRGAFMGAGLTISTIVPTSMIGIIALFLIPGIADPFTIFPTIALEHVPFWVGALMLMGVLGAAMSTANGGLLAISSVVSRNLIQRDILRRWLKRPGMDDKSLLRTTRIFTIPMMAAAFILAYLLPQPGIYLILAFDIVFAGAWAPLTLGLFWKKSNMPAAVTSLLVGTGLRLLMFFLVGGVIPLEYAGIETFIPPPISFALFIIVALATQKKYPGEKRHGVVDYVPPEEDVVRGEDLKGYIEPVSR
jgi:Na+/proline symporter